MTDGQKKEQTNEQQTDGQAERQTKERKNKQMNEH
jgi:hypothetical protein